MVGFSEDDIILFYESCKHNKVCKKLNKIRSESYLYFSEFWETKNSFLKDITHMSQEYIIGSRKLSAEGLSNYIFYRLELNANSYYLQKNRYLEKFESFCFKEPRDRRIKQFDKSLAFKNLENYSKISICKVSIELAKKNLFRQNEKHEIEEMVRRFKLKYDTYMKTKEWYFLRKKCLDRSNNECEFCGEIAQTAHHVIYPKKYSEDKLENLVAVCKSCHSLCHGIRNDIKTKWKRT